VQTLAEMPPVFDGDVLTVFGRAPGRLPKRVTLSCKTPTGPAQWTVAVPPPLEDGGVIATMWARRTIQSLEEVNRLHTSRHVRRGKAQKSREEETVIRLSKQFNLLSSLTTFIALEHRSEAERNNGRPALRRVPLMLAEGWGAIEQMRGGRGGYTTLAAGGAAPTAAPAPDFEVCRRASIDPKSFMDELEEKRESHAAAYDGRPRGKMRSFLNKMGLSKSLREGTEADSPQDDLHALLSLLDSRGAFSNDSFVDATMRKGGRDPVAWRREVTASVPAGAPGGVKDAVRTVIVLLLLRDQFGGREDVWRRAAGKARRYVRSALNLQPGQLDEWLKELESKLLVAAGAPKP
jgi:hypothetical protein